MTGAEARRRFAAARVAVLATADAAGTPHLVPVTFGLDGDTVWTAVDGKPKRSTTLRRHANVRARPQVSLLVEHWDEDWSRLWWVRADGTGTVDGSAAAVDRAAALLAGKYDQYRTVPVVGPALRVAVHEWRGWAAAPG